MIEKNGTAILQGGLSKFKMMTAAGTDTIASPVLCFVRLLRF